MPPAAGTAVDVADRRKDGAVRSSEWFVATRSGSGPPRAPLPPAPGRSFSRSRNRRLNLSQPCHMLPIAKHQNRPMMLDRSERPARGNMQALWSEQPIPGSQSGMADHAPKHGGGGGGRARRGSPPCRGFSRSRKAAVVLSSQQAGLARSRRGPRSCGCDFVWVSLPDYWP